MNFWKKETIFWNTVGPNVVMPNPEKVKVINIFPIPKTQKETKSLLGPCGFTENPFQTSQTFQSL